MARIGRLLFLLVFLLGLVVAGLRLAALDTPLTDVAVTGVLVLLGVVALLLLLPAVGKLLGRLTSEKDEG